MTIETTTRKVIALGNGSATSFSFSPLILTQSSDLVVVKTDSSGNETTLVETTDYTVVVSSYPGTGSITYPATGTTKLASGESVTMRPVLALTQATALNNQGGYFADVQEAALDKLTLLTQQLQEQLDRSLKVAVSDSDSPADLPVASLRANTLLGFNSDGDPIATTTTPDTAISAAMIDVVQATTLANARTALGLGTAAVEDAGTGANDLLKLDSNGKIPAVDGSQITGSPGWKTGMAVLTLQDTADTGWVMFDDGTIGDASSGATNRANADTSALFALIWAKINNTNCPIQDSSGTASTRGATAAADFAAHKRMPLPKALGHVLGVAGAGSGLTSRSLGDTVGAETHTLAKTEIPKSTITTPVQNTGTAGTGNTLMLGTSNSANSTTLITDDFAASPTAISLVQPTTFLNVMVKL